MSSRPSPSASSIEQPEEWMPGRAVVAEAAVMSAKVPLPLLRNRWLPVPSVPTTKRSWSPSLSISPKQAPVLSCAVAATPAAPAASTKVREPPCANWLWKRLLAWPGPLVT